MIKESKHGLHHKVRIFNEVPFNILNISLKKDDNSLTGKLFKKAKIKNLNSVKYQPNRVI